jgi:two-component system cell cycle sensor histidine kinase/response regulator CckA
LLDEMTDRSAQTAERDGGGPLLRLIMDSVPAFLAYLGPDYRYQFINRQYERSFGRLPDQIIGKTVREVLGDVTFAERRPFLERALAGELVEFPSKVALAPGVAPREVRVTYVPDVGGDGRTRGIVVLVSDITELRVQEDVAELRRTQANLVLTERMASVGTLAAGVAHEINNPLSCVTGNLEVLAEEVGKMSRDPGAAGKAQLLEIIAEAREAADRVRRIVRDLKTLSPADEDRRAPIDLHRVLDLSINMASSEIRHRARLDKEFGPVPLVAADEARLGQVFLNLLVNAAQALPDGHADRHGIRIVTKTDASGRAVVEVHDTGPGIPPEIRGRIFDPFFTTKPVGVAIGLGLSICHVIVTSLGGEIVAESPAGGGCVIRVSLPAAAEPARSTAPAVVPASTKQEGRRGSILIVDDDDLVARSLGRALKKHDVVAARSGKQALELLASGRTFDVILCDLMMPEMTGMDVHAELAKTRPELAERMVFITGGAFTPEARSFLDRVSNERLEKPVDMKTLRGVVDERLT